jgi:hypothetical protein
MQGEGSPANRVAFSLLTLQQYSTTLHIEDKYMIIPQEEYPVSDILEHPEFSPDNSGKWQYLAMLASQPGGMEVLIELGALAYPSDPSDN